MGINKTSYTTLKKFEKVFACAVRSNYAVIEQKDYAKIIDTYYGNSVLKAPAMSAYNCSKCKLKELIKIGKEYFAFEEEMKNKE